MYNREYERLYTPESLGWLMGIGQKVNELMQAYWVPITIAAFLAGSNIGTYYTTKNELRDKPYNIAQCRIDQFWDSEIMWIGKIGMYVAAKQRLREIQDSKHIYTPS